MKIVVDKKVHTIRYARKVCFIAGASNKSVPRSLSVQMKFKT